MLRLSKYIVYDILRSKIIIAYTLFLFVVSMSLFRLDEDGNRALISLLTIVLLVVPLVSMIFSTIHYYNSYEFIELMLAQPLSRTKILLNEYAGVAVSLNAAYLIGVGVPVVIFSSGETGIALLIIGVLLTLAFTSISFFASVKSRDKARGIGAAILLWFYFALIYDGLVMLILFSFSDYPMEKFTLLLSALNPIDMGRIFILLKMDTSALMGYTGALYKDFFGSGWGLMFTFGAMLLWIIIPLAGAVLTFKRKDL
jgi:Cu-processing system permease protein